MRLKEPLEGIKPIAEGNLVVYLAFFINGLIMLPFASDAMKTDPDTFTKWEVIEMETFHYLRIGHIVAIVFIIFNAVSSGLCSSKGAVTLQTSSNFLSLFIYYIGYLLPIFLAVHSRQYRVFIDVPEGENYYSSNYTPYSVFLLEIIGYFFASILAGALFVLIAYIFKLNQRKV